MYISTKYLCIEKCLLYLNICSSQKLHKRNRTRVSKIYKNKIKIDVLCIVTLLDDSNFHKLIY